MNRVSEKGRKWTYANGIGKGGAEIGGELLSRLHLEECGVSPLASLWLPSGILTVCSTNFHQKHANAIQLSIYPFFSLWEKVGPKYGKAQTKRPIFFLIILIVHSLRVCRKTVKYGSCATHKQNLPVEDNSFLILTLILTLEGMTILFVKFDFWIFLWKVFHILLCLNWGSFFNYIDCVACNVSC